MMRCMNDAQNRLVANLLDLATSLHAQGDLLTRRLTYLGALALVLALAVAWIAYLASKRIRELEEQVEDLKEQTEVDDLTGTLRRGAGERYARMAMRMFPCVVAFVDVNGLGAVNKEEGHDAGDDLLRLVTARLLHSFGRAHDIVYRRGGDEFVVVLPAIETDRSELPEGEVPRDPLDVTLTYAAQALDDASEQGVAFTYAFTTTRAHAPQDALRVVDAEVCEMKRRRRALHAAAALAPTTQATEEKSSDGQPGPTIHP